MLDRKYVRRAEKNVVRRHRHGIAGPAAQQSDYDSFLGSFTSATFDNDDIYEGGEERNETNKGMVQTADFTSQRIQMRRPQNHVKGSYQSLTTRRGMVTEESLDYETFNNAVDMYIEENSYVLSYKALDDSLKKRNMYFSDESEEESLDTSYESSESSGEYEGINLRPKRIEYAELPSYKGLKYKPPPFRNSYELSIWKADINSVTKIKGSYFTPDSKKISHPDFQGFEMDISLDKETLLIYERDSLEEETLVMIFDAYTLDKIIEVPLNTCMNINSSHMKEYEQSEDFVNPETNSF